MRADRFRPLLTAKGPFASIYFDDSHDTQDAAAQLELKWRGIREQLVDEGVAADMIADVDAAINDIRPPVGRSGRGVVAGPDGVLLNEHLIRPPATMVVRVSDLPYLVPMVELGHDHRTYVVVAVDHVGADITLHGDDGVVSETVEGGGYPVHKAAAAEDRWYGDPQRRAEEQRAKNIGVVAHRLGELVDLSGTEVVFVIGEVRSRADLVAALPERVAGRVVELHVGARASGVETAQVHQAIDEELQRRRSAVCDDAVGRFRAQLGSGLAVEGIPEVCSALRQGAVDTLLIGDLSDATVVDDDDLANVAPDADALSQLGTAPTRVLRADEALPLLAVSIDASLVCTDISPLDGVAAVLRYAPTGE